MSTNKATKSEAAEPVKKYWGKLAYLNYQKPVYNKSTVKTNPHQVAAYTARKNMKSAVKELSPPADILVDQILNPEDATEIERWPNTYGLSAVYKCKTVLNAKFDPTGRSCVSVSPTIKDAIFATYGDSANVSLTPYSVDEPGVNTPYSFQNIILDQINQRTDWSSPIICGNGQALTPFPSASNKHLLYPVGFTATATSPNVSEVYLRMRFPNSLTSQAMVSVRLYDSNQTFIAGTSVNTDYKSANSEGYGVDILIGDSAGQGISPLANVSYMSITIYGRWLPYKGPVYVWFNRNNIPALNGQATIILPNHAQHVGIYDIKDANQIQESASQAFVLSQSLLLTAEMSDINNGGMLSIARVPGASPIGLDSNYSAESITSNNWYEWLSSLSYNSYDGPVKDGGYGFYLPEDEVGYFYRPVDNYFTAKLPYLASEFTVNAGLQDAAIVRIKICTIVQFTTTASIYDQRPSCHLMEKELIHHILSLVPPCYSNDGHLDGLKKNLKKVGGKVKYLLRNPKTYEVTAKALLTLASLI